MSKLFLFRFLQKGKSPITQPISYTFLFLEQSNSGIAYAKTIKPSQELDIPAGHIFRSISKRIRLWRQRERKKVRIPPGQGKKMKD
jgi:hypothetical protein